MSRLFDDAQTESLNANGTPVATVPLGISAWAYFDDLTGVCTVICLGDASLNKNIFALDMAGSVANDPVRAFVGDGGCGVAQLASAVSINTWHHIAGLFLSNTSRYVYVDGVASNEDTTNITPSGLDEIAIGELLWDSRTNFMSGKIAEVGVWDLTAWGADAAERKAAFETALAQLALGETPDSYPTGLEAYWSFKTSSLEDEADDFDLIATGTTFSSDHPPISFLLAGSIAATSGVTGSLTVFNFFWIDNDIIFKDGDVVWKDYKSITPIIEGSVTSIAAILASLEVLTDLQGSITATSGVDGSSNVLWVLQGSMDAISGADGFLDLQPGLESFVDTIANVDGFIDLQPGLGSSINEISGVAAILASLEVLTDLQGSITATSGVDGSSNVLWVLQGSMDAISGADGFLDLQPGLESFVDTIANVDGFIDLQPGLGSSINEISGVAATLASLEVLTDLVGSTTATSGADGSLNILWVLQGSTDGISGTDDSLNVLTPLQGSTDGVSGANGSFDLQPGLESSVDAILTIAVLFDLQPGLGSSVVEISGIAATLASLEVLTDLVGSITAISDVDGFLDLQPGLESSVDGVSGINGSLDLQPGLGSSIVEISGVAATLASLEVLTDLVGSVIAISGVNAIIKGLDHRGSIDATSGITGSLEILINLQGSIDATFGTDGFLNVLTPLQGFADGTSGADSSLDLQPECKGSIDGVSGVDGFLDLQTGLGSSVVEISGVAATLASLEVLTDLVGSIAGTSGADGSLNVLWVLQSFVDATSGAEGFSNVSTPLVGSIDGVSGVDGSLDLQPGCVGSVAGISDLPDSINYLSIIPNFFATATLLWRPQNNILETLEWKTSILKAYDGTEQRIKIRQTPRQYFKLQLVLKTDKINTRFDSFIHSRQKLAWFIPIWSEYVKHSSSIAAKADFITIDTTNADFRNSSKAIVWKSSTENEVVAIDTKTNLQLNLSYPMLNSFSGNKYIVPVRTAYLISSSKKEKSNSPVAIVDLVFAVYDNIEITGYVPNANYDGYEILDTPAFMDNSHLESSDGDIFITDFKTGIFKVKSTSNFNRLVQDHNFFNDTKATCWNFRKFLHSLNGQQKTILIPTFRDDVIQTNDIGTSDTSVNIENIQLTENMGFNSLRTYIGFYFPLTDVLIVRKITAITELSSIEEQISFNSILGLASPIVSGDCKICFVDKCRLASDKIQIRWPYSHKNECQTNFMRIV